MSENNEKRIKERLELIEKYMEILIKESGRPTLSTNRFMAELREAKTGSRTPQDKTPTRL